MKSVVSNNKSTREATYSEAYFDAFHFLSTNQKSLIREHAEKLLDCEPNRLGAYRQTKHTLAFAGVVGLPAKIFAFVLIYGVLPRTNAKLKGRRR